jgi:hypothetical protein
MTRKEAIHVLQRELSVLQHSETDFGSALKMALGSLMREEKSARSGKHGGSTTAKKYSKKIRRQWGKRGGRPKKKPVDAHMPEDA